MANRLSSKLVKNHPGRHRQFARILKSAPASIAVTLPQPDFNPDPIPTFTRPLHPKPEILDLHDVNLFATVPTTKLLKSTATLKMVSIDPIVDLGMWVMKSKLVETPIAREIILGVTKRTFYEQFVAGEDVTEMSRTVRSIWSSGLKSMLNYGLEHAHDNASCDDNFKAIMETVESNKTLPPPSVSSVIVKITAIYPIPLLQRVSDLLRWEQRNPSSIKLPWKQSTLPIFSDSTPLYHTQTQPEPLTPEEEKDLELGNQRLNKICTRCAELDVPVTVDAEETTVQPAIDYLTYSSARLFNSGKRPLVFGTIQAYLKDAKGRMCLAMEAAEKMGLSMGFKLVRGAYMSFESRVAGSLGFDSPVHDTIQDTHDCYHDCASYLVDKVASGSGALILATHNVESGRRMATMARDYGIGKENDRLQFAQLYGMSDALSYGLSNAGFQVSKYLTFGPIEEVMPYLLRRAEENRGVLSSSALDRMLMWNELKRRMGVRANGLSVMDAPSKSE
ncbi:uncharacterized protein [Phyllobates terribilis]|uniref:uncharacterized protein n=1 Tax=Phyllobates terribilis TaxID=111132 RepID=UPI003CCA939E